MFCIISSFQAELLTRMISKDPKKRPSAGEIKGILAPTSEIIDNCPRVEELVEKMRMLEIKIAELEGERNKSPSNGIRRQS